MKPTAWISAAMVAAGTAVMLVGVSASEVPVKRTIVFVHGAWAGGWHFHKVQPLLEALGFSVLRPTLTGLGERLHLASPEVDLSTHVEDIVRVLEFEALHDVVLVGHSYGGMVIAGVAERVPDRIGQLVFMDAVVPVDGESIMDLAGHRIAEMTTLDGSGEQPWLLVPNWVDAGKPPPVDVPQPLATFTETIRLHNPAARELSAAYILTVEAGRDGDDFDPFAERAQQRGWTVVTMEGGHNPHWFQPERFTEVLVGVLAGKTPVSPPALDDLVWMTGCWRSSVDDVTMEEIWLAPSGGVMPGIHRDTHPSGRSFLEFLNVVHRDGTIIYEARPGGGTPTEFVLAESGGKRAVFSNPEHDFPKRITYWSDGSFLAARIDGGTDDSRSSEWSWNRVDCDTDP